MCVCVRRRETGGEWVQFCSTMESCFAQWGGLSNLGQPNHVIVAMAMAKARKRRGFVCVCVCFACCDE